MWKALPELSLLEDRSRRVSRLFNLKVAKVKTRCESENLSYIASKEFK
jgi:hypothetical protein